MKVLGAAMIAMVLTLGGSSVGSAMPPVEQVTQAPPAWFCDILPMMPGCSF